MAVPAAAAPAAPGILPPPVGPPRGATAPPPPAPPFVPPPPRRRRWLLPVIAGGSALLLGLGALGVWGAVQLGQSLRQLPGAVPPPAAPPAAPVAGDPGEPTAEQPLDCEGCFTFYDATTLRLSPRVYQEMGLAATDGDTVSTDLASERELLAAQWADYRGDPDECAFAFPQAPLLDPLAEPDAASADDRVHYPAWHWDDRELFWLTEGIRLFDDSAAASAHLEGVAAALAGCDAYSLPETGWAVTLDPAAALELPPSVAAYGWVETGGYNRYYAVDLQRGNLVLRLTLNGSGGGPDEAAFRAFVEDYAVALAELEPTG